MQFLLENSDARNLQAAPNLSSGGTYPNLYHLLELDTEATLDVLRCAFVENENPKPDFSLHDGANVNMEAKQENNILAESQNLLVQNTIDSLVQIIEKHISQAEESASSDDAASVEAWPSKKDVGHLFEFIAYHVTFRKAHVSNSVLSQILEYLTLESTFAPDIPVHIIETSKKREKQVLALLEVVPEADWDASYVLQLCEKAQFHQVFMPCSSSVTLSRSECLLIYIFFLISSYSWLLRWFQVCGFINTIRHQYLAALDSYMKDADEPIHIFSYINNMLEQLSNNECNAFRSAIMSRIPELVILSR